MFSFFSTLERAQSSTFVTGNCRKYDAAFLKNIVLSKAHGTGSMRKSRTRSRPLPNILYSERCFFNVVAVVNVEGT
jgi:hypothetical protein